MQDPYNLQYIDMNESKFGRWILQHHYESRLNNYRGQTGYDMNTVEPISPFIIAKEHFEWNDE